jgi:hypothetical protein
MHGWHQILLSPNTNSIAPRWLALPTTIGQWPSQATEHLLTLTLSNSEFSYRAFFIRDLLHLYNVEYNSGHGCSQHASGRRT